MDALAFIVGLLAISIVIGGLWWRRERHLKTAITRWKARRDDAIASRDRWADRAITAEQAVLAAGVERESLRERNELLVELLAGKDYPAALLESPGLLQAWADLQPTEPFTSTQFAQDGACPDV